MPFIVDLPPKKINEVKTNIENVAPVQNGNEHRLDSENIYNLDENMFENVYLHEKFNSLVKEWKKNTMFQSSISKITEDYYFLEIIKMGKKGIPLIIENIKKEPSVLVWALNIITNESLDSGPGRKTISDLCKRWVKYHEKGLIKNI